MERTNEEILWSNFKEVEPFNDVDYPTFQAIIDEVFRGIVGTEVVEYWKEKALKEKRANPEKGKKE